MGKKDLGNQPEKKKDKREGIPVAQALVLTHQQEEEFETFTNRAQKVIRLANIPSLSNNQIAILFYLDMLTNELLIKKKYMRTLRKYSCYPMIKLWKELS